MKIELHLNQAPLPKELCLHGPPSIGLQHDEQQYISSDPSAATSADQRAVNSVPLLPASMLCLPRLGAALASSAAARPVLQQ